LKLFEYLKQIQGNWRDCKVAYSKEGKRVSDEVKANSQIKSYPASKGCQLLKTPLMNERKYKNKLGGNIGILCEVHAPHGPLATALCCVYQSCSAIIYKSGLNFTIVN